MPGSRAVGPRFTPRRMALVLGAFALMWAAALAAIAMASGAQSDYTHMATFFTQSALVTFGGAYAVLPYVIETAVETHHWATAAQMIDGLALGETTPGPLIMLVAFVGFILTGLFMAFFNGRLGIPYLLAQVMTTGVVLVRSFVANRLWTFSPAPL